MRSLLTVTVILLILPGACLAGGKPPRYAWWDWFDAAAIPVLTRAGITDLLAEHPPAPFRTACEKAGIRIVAPDTGSGFNKVTNGKWPGFDPLVQSGDSATAGASGDPWIDTNGWLLQFARALNPAAPLLLYEPPRQSRLRPGSIELAIADARVFGGDVAIRLDERMRRGLESGQPRVLKEWDRVASEYEFTDSLANQPPAANIAVVVANVAPAKDVVIMLLRKNLACVALARSSATPEAIADYGLVIAVAQPPLVLKSGNPKRIVIERREVPQPNRFANEMGDMLGDQRLYRVSNAETVIGYPRRTPDGKLAIHLVNYAIDPVQDVGVAVRGDHRHARLLAPERVTPLDLDAKDGQFVIPEMRIHAVLIVD